MDINQDAFHKELLADFKIEASEHHMAIVNGLLELEKHMPVEGSNEMVETTFREIHSLKGASRAVNLTEIERLCQSMEGVFHAVKQGTLELNLPVFDTMHKASDYLNVMLTEIDQKEKSVSANSLAQMMRRLESIQHGATAPAKMKFTLPPIVNEPPREIKEDKVVYEVPENQKIKDTVRISTAKLGKLLQEAEEFITLKSTLGHYIKELHKRNHRDLHGLLRELDQFNHMMSRMIDDLLLDIKTTLLYPFSTLLEIVPKIVRDLGKEYKKEIRVDIKGGDIEIDRRILDELKDPIIHLIRNCIDHGIETGEIRLSKGKTPVGLLEILITHNSGNHVEMIIRDDGAGIERKTVINSALKQGVVTKETAAAMSDQDVYSLILKSGVSTSPFITDISGRGLGMAIVAEKISKLCGTLSINAEKGKGTIFTLALPVTLATFRGILVKVGQQTFIIPTAAVEKALRVYTHEIRTARAKQYIVWKGENIAMVRLGDVLNIPCRAGNTSPDLPQPVLMISHAASTVAFTVDEVFGEQEGIVKNLGSQLVHIRNISGAIVLGNGKIIPILNIQELMESASERLTSAVESTSPISEISTQGKKKILVAEDSITLRSLLRNIIESAGYEVKTAVDGLEAFQFLSDGSFDLVVTDVEMPHMNGFDLTSRIRGDKRFSEIPVILVTALDSAEDKQRGMESGANAYIVKGSFEQSNLLETMRRLI